MPTLQNLFDPTDELVKQRAADAWRRIQDYPTTIKVKRTATVLADQVVRIEANNTTGEISGMGGQSSNLSVTVFGVRGHATVTTTDLKRDDVFVVHGVRYRVVHVVYPVGELQAFCEAQA
jgi:hypothetical protein